MWLSKSRESTEVVIGVIAKIYLAELIEEARCNMEEDEEHIRPDHLEMAFLNLKNQGKLDFNEMEVRDLFDE